MQDFCFHIHTPRCGHADASQTDAEIAKLFYEAGFNTIAFTDHSPWKTLLEKFPNHSMPWSQKEEYLESIHNLAKQYDGKMKIYTGFESEYIPSFPDEMKEIRSLSEILVLGQHFTRAVDGTYLSLHKKGYVPNDDELDFYGDCIENSCKEHFADIIAHPDVYMIQKSHFEKKDEELAHRICAVAEQYDVPVEINLCLPCKDRFFQSCEITYPRSGFWKVATQYKLRTIFGLDYHGHFDPVYQNEMIDSTVKLLGESTVAKLHLCTKEEII